MDTIIAPIVGIVASFVLQIFKKYKMPVTGTAANYIMIGLAVALGLLDVWVSGKWNTADFLVTAGLVIGSAQAVFALLVKNIIKTP